MPREESTDQLVDLVRSKPNPETADFEIKSRRILDSTPGKKKLIRHVAGIANKTDFEGGTLLVGVNEEGIVEGFDDDEEPIQDLVNLSLEYTNPPIHTLFDTSFDNVEGDFVLRIDTDPPQDGPIRYTGQGDSEMPIRKHDSTRSMESEDIRRFYARQRAIDHEEIEFYAEAEYDGIDRWYQINSSSEDIDTWGFFDCKSPQGYFVYDTTKRNLDREETEDFFAALQHFFRPSYWSGLFTIAQWRASWFGQGLGNFYDSLRHREERYESLAPEQLLENHHSESGLFICDWKQGLLVINCISERATEGLEKVGVHLISKGVPVDTRDLAGFMDKTDTSFRDARTLEDILSGHIEFQDGVVNLSPVDYWHDSLENPWIVGLVVENPFSGTDQLFDKAVGERYLDSIASFDRVYCHLSDHSFHSPDGPFDYEYYLKAVEWWDMDPLQLPINAQNIRLVAERSRKT